VPIAPPAPNNNSSGIFQVGGKGNSASQVTAQATPENTGQSLRPDQPADLKIILIGASALLIVGTLAYLIIKK
jgi:hypothetical protein